MNFTPTQQAAKKLIATHRHFMAFGGSRSGKTFLLVYVVILRAIKAPKSRHAILRYRLNSIKASIMMDTFPKVMELCFPGVNFKINNADYYCTFDNGSQVFFGGLDDKDRTEKILGQEYCTIYLNECSQIPWSSVGIALTRLAQSCVQVDGTPLSLRMLYDCNPPDKLHWTYKLFVAAVSPDTEEKLKTPQHYGSIQMNPGDNSQHLPEEYIEELENMPAHLKRRFLYGEFSDANPNALFPQEHIDQWRVHSLEDIPDMVRIVVGVDPSGASAPGESSKADAIGIYVAGLGVDGVVYLMEDCTITGRPETWGKVATDAYWRHDADLLVAETNYGGDMVRMVIATADPDVNFMKVTASRGKTVRAEPFSPFFCDGRVRIVGRQNDLENELSGFSTTGYTGERSPNVADACIWCLTVLFPKVIKPRASRNAPVSVMATVNEWN